MSNYGILENEPFELREKKLQTYTGWYAPSMFGTSYGKLGYKIEVDAYHYTNGKQDGGYSSHNCDGSNFRAAKRFFWNEWNKEHGGEHLWIGKFMSSYGL
jgi:hypothetical protein